MKHAPKTNFISKLAGWSYLWSVSPSSSPPMLQVTANETIGGGPLSTWKSTGPVTPNQQQYHLTGLINTLSLTQEAVLKVMLLLDNVRGHSKFLVGHHPSVQVVFLPPITTAVLQPLDQELISTVKLMYYLPVWYLEVENQLAEGT